MWDAHWAVLRKNVSIKFLYEDRHKNSEQILANLR